MHKHTPAHTTHTTHTAPYLPLTLTETPLQSQDSLLGNSDGLFFPQLPFEETDLNTGILSHHYWEFYF